jgi:ferritin-like metal-binding protein YciE
MKKNKSTSKRASKKKIVRVNRMAPKNRTASKGRSLKKAIKKIVPKVKTDTESLNELFLEEIKDIYWAEKHLVKAIGKMIKASTSEELKEAFSEHLSVTEEHVKRLEQVFDLLGEKRASKKCDAIEGLTKEAEEVISETGKGTLTRDAGLIIAAQKVEHYEIATYGSLAQWARTLGKDDIAHVFEKTLAEEKEADEVLTKIAVGGVNDEAMVGKEEELQDAEE